MLEFFSMGGYAAYVWSAFGFTAVCMLGLLAVSIRSAKLSAAEFEVLRNELRPRRNKKAQPMRPRRANESDISSQTTVN